MRTSPPDKNSLAQARTRSFPGRAGTAAASEQAPAPHTDLVGQSIGQYRLVRQLGRGGMGVVYEAVHQEIGQRAAVKTLPAASTADSAYAQRFLNEARAAIIAQHASLVKIFDSGKLRDGTLYILMELLEGETLSKRLCQKHERVLHQAETVRVVRQVASAMAVAHAKGIVHRGLFASSTIAA